jgi:glycine dehydrogenase
MVEPAEGETSGAQSLLRRDDQIREEIGDVVSGRADRADNVLKHSPHTMEVVAPNAWTHAYSRADGVCPASGSYIARADSTSAAFRHESFPT